MSGIAPVVTGSLRNFSHMRNIARTNERRHAM